MNISRTLFVLLLTGICACLQAQIEVNIEDASADNGQSVAIDVSVNNYDSLSGHQFSVNWDSTVLEFASVSNLNGDLGLMMDDFATPSQLGRADAMTHIWSIPDDEGASIPDGSILFTINFTVIGQGCDQSAVALSDDPRRIAFTRYDGIEQDVNANNGTVDVTPCSTGGDITLTGSMETGENGDEVCVQITADGFQEIFAAQWSHSYNNSVLQFSQLTNFGLAGLDASSFNVNESNGTISFSYLPAGGGTESVPDGTVLYEICFTIIGSSGQMSDIPFTDNPTTIEVVQVQGGSPTEVTPVTNSGKVSVTGDFSGLTISFPDIDALPGDTVCAPLTFENVDDLQGLQDITISWDTDVLTYINSQNREAPGNDFLENATQVGNGVYSFAYVYVGPTGEGWSTDSATFIELCFEVVGECFESTDLDISENLFIVNSMSDFIPYVVADGSVLINCANCMADPLVSNVSCGGSGDGSIDLQLSNCPDITSIDWEDPDITDGSPVANDLDPGTYSVTVTYNGGSDEAIFEAEVGDDNINLSASDISECTSGNDGTIDITVSGGSGNYTFEWDTGDNTEDISGVSCGDHTVTVTDADNPSCVVEFGPFDVPCPVTFEPSVDQVSCNGDEDGSIELVVSGGTGDYTFDWDPDVGSGNSVSGLGPGDYDVTITDENGCTAEATFTITEPDAISIDDVTIEDDIMGDGEGEISIEVTGGTGTLDINWSNGGDGEQIIALECGTYTVTVEDENSCTLEESYELDGIAISSSITNVDCFGENSGSIDIEVTCGEGTFEYAWDDEGNSTTEDLNNVTAGSYTVTITSSVGNMLVRSFEVLQPGAALAATVQVDEDGCPEDASALVTVTGGTEPYDIQWNTIPPQTGPLATGLESGTFMAFINDANGCEIIAQAEVQCAPPVPCYEAMPIITPNGDGLNDFFIIACAPDMQNTLRIFTRWGENIYTASNYLNDWDGVDESGDEVENGTYMWVLEVFEPDGDTRIIKGTVTVQRDFN